MMMEALVFALLLPSVASLAVTVRLPAVLSVRLKVCVPPDNAASVGRVALLSLDVICAVSLTVLTRFQLASTAFTVTLNAVPAVCAVGVPVLPMLVPAAAVSPGANNCSLAKVPALTVIAALVLAV